MTSGSCTQMPSSENIRTWPGARGHHAHLGELRACQAHR